MSNIFSWLWPFGKKKEEVEKSEFTNYYSHQLEEVKRINSLLISESPATKALRLDKERREARIEELSKARMRARHSCDNHTLVDRGMDVLGAAAVGYAVSSMINNGDSYSSSSNDESHYSGGDFDGGGSSDSWGDSDGGDSSSD